MIDAHGIEDFTALVTEIFRRLPSVVLRLFSFYLESTMKPRLRSSCVSIQWKSCLQNFTEVYKKEMPSLYVFQTLLRMRGIKKRDFNLSVCFPLPSLPPIRQPTMPMYCFHSQKLLPPRLIEVSDHCSVGEVRERTGMKTALTYFVFREKVVLAEQPRGMLLVLFHLWRKSSIYPQNEHQPRARK